MNALVGLWEHRPEGRGVTSASNRSYLSTRGEQRECIFFPPTPAWVKYFTDRLTALRNSTYFQLMRTWSSTQHRVCLANFFVNVIASRDRALPVITTFSNRKMLPKEMLLLFVLSLEFYISYKTTVLYTNVNWQIDCNGHVILYSRERKKNQYFQACHSRRTSQEY